MKDIDVAGTLFQKNFGSEESTSESKKFIAPATKMQVSVDIDLIRPYENNPRRTENEKFLEIKESIREIGLQQPFSITCKPGQEHYIIRSGGNTRLRALKELYQETGEDRFKKIVCTYEPYTDDLELLSLHMMENEQRGRMVFIDIARAAMSFKELFEKQTGKPLGLRPLSAEMKKRGWAVPFQNLPYYLYATEIEDVLQTAFKTGLGRKIVSDIRKIEDLIKKWVQHRHIDENKALQYFKNVLSENDTDARSLNITKINNDLYMRLASQFQLRVNDVVNDFKVMLNTGTEFFTDDDEVSMENTVESAIQSTPLSQSIGSVFQPNHSPSGSSLMPAPILSEPTIESVPMTTGAGATRRNPLEVERDKAKHQIRELLGWIINQFKDFDKCFPVAEKEEYIFTSLYTPKKFSGAREMFPADVMGVWYAIHSRLQVIKVAIEFKDNAISAREKLNNLTNGNYLNGDSYLPSIIYDNFVSLCQGLLPEEMMNGLCSIIQPEVRNIYRYFPQLDILIQRYIQTLKP